MGGSKCGCTAGGALEQFREVKKVKHHRSEQSERSGKYYYFTCKVCEERIRSGNPKQRVCDSCQRKERGS